MVIGFSVWNRLSCGALSRFLKLCNQLLGHSSLRSLSSQYITKQTTYVIRSKELCVCPTSLVGGAPLGEWACVMVRGPCWCGYEPCTSFVNPGQFELCSVEGSSKLGVPCIHGPMPQGTRVHLAIMVPNSKGTISHPQFIAEEQHLPLNLRGMTSFHVPLNFHEAHERMVHLFLAGLSPPSLFFNLKRPCVLLVRERFPSLCAFLFHRL